MWWMCLCFRQTFACQAAAGIVALVAGDGAAHTCLAVDVDAGGDVAMACAVAATVAFCGRSFFVSYSGLFVFARYYGEKHGV